MSPFQLLKSAPNSNKMTPQNPTKLQTKSAPNTTHFQLHIHHYRHQKWSKIYKKQPPNQSMKSAQNQPLNFPWKATKPTPKRPPYAHHFQPRKSAPNSIKKPFKNNNKKNPSKQPLTRQKKPHFGPKTTGGSSLLCSRRGSSKTTPSRQQSPQSNKPTTATNKRHQKISPPSNDATRRTPNSNLRLVDRREGPTKFV